MALVLQITPGEPTFGVWCPHCKLPSGFELPMYCMSEHGISRIATYRRCHDCDEPITEES